jgi:uncharacterized Fe-S cluster-containing MiaB family protein
MDLCNSDHDEICYEGRKCPMCEYISDSEAEDQEYRDRIEQLENYETLYNDLYEEVKEIYPECAI